MRAAWYERQGPVREVLVVGEMRDPRPAAGEVRIRIAASAINSVHVRPADTEGADLDEPAVGQREQRAKWINWTNHCARDSGGRAGPKKLDIMLCFSTLMNQTSRAGAGNGIGRSNAALAKVNRALLAPIPIATPAVRMNPGERRRLRMARERSFKGI